MCVRILYGSETLLKEDDRIRVSRGRLDEVQRHRSKKTDSEVGLATMAPKID